MSNTKESQEDNNERFSASIRKVNRSTAYIQEEKSDPYVHAKTDHIERSAPDTDRTLSDNER